MLDLEGLLEREGMEPGLRHLIYLTVAVAEAEWDRLEAAVASARKIDVRRSDLEETLLQATLFFGFPRVVTAFERLVSAWPAPAPRGGGLPREQWVEAGRKLFSSIYGDNEASVRTMLAGFHRDFHDFVLEAAYGRVLSRPALEPRIRELLAVAALAAFDQKPQAVAHGRGALGFGASVEEVREAVFTALGDAHACQQLLTRILRVRRT